MMSLLVVCSVMSARKDIKMYNDSPPLLLSPFPPFALFWLVVSSVMALGKDMKNILMDKLGGDKFNRDKEAGGGEGEIRLSHEEIFGVCW